MLTQQKEIVVFCPYFRCQKVLFRKATLDIETDKKNVMSYETLCPHCREKVRMWIGVDAKAEAII